MNTARLESLNGMIESIINNINNTKKKQNNFGENHHKECEREIRNNSLFQNTKHLILIIIRLNKLMKF